MSKSNRINITYLCEKKKQGEQHIEIVRIPIGNTLYTIYNSMK